MLAFWARVDFLQAGGKGMIYTSKVNVFVQHLEWDVGTVCQGANSHKVLANRGFLGIKGNRQGNQRESQRGIHRQMISTFKNWAPQIWETRPNLKRKRRQWTGWVLLGLLSVTSFPCEESAKNPLFQYLLALFYCGGGLCPSSSKFLQVSPPTVRKRQRVLSLWCCWVPQCPGSFNKGLGSIWPGTLTHGQARG